MENKINIACFKSGSRTAEAKDIWQWDYGQILRIQGLILPTAVEIHFSLDEHGGEAARRIGVTKDGVTDVVVPDTMLENESAYGDSYYFFAYIYLSDEESGNTEYKIRAKVSTRSKPEGYNSGDSTFAEILKTVNEIAEDKVDIPAPAKVGQVIAVSEVDEEGKPIKFEAKDMSGGVSAGTGLSTEAIDKLEEVGNYLAYTTADGGSKWTELISILRNGSSGGGSGETEVTLESISATYTGGDVMEGTALSDLTGITVTATYSDGSTANVTGYSLSGEILEGENTITVSYGGLTCTFAVIGVAENTDETDINEVSLWEIGGINPNGSSAANATRLRTVDYIPSGVKKITADVGYSYILVVYNDEGSVLNGTRGYYNPNGDASSASANATGFLVNSGTYYTGELIIEDVLSNIGLVNTYGVAYNNIKIILRNENNTSATLATDDALHIHLWE